MCASESLFRAIKCFYLEAACRPSWECPLATEYSGLMVAKRTKCQICSPYFHLSVQRGKWVKVFPAIGLLGYLLHGCLGRWDRTKKLSVPVWCSLFNFRTKNNSTSHPCSSVFRAVIFGAYSSVKQQELCPCFSFGYWSLIHMLWISLPLHVSLQETAGEQWEKHTSFFPKRSSSS